MTAAQARPANPDLSPQPHAVQRILVVDDSLAQRRVLVAMLTRWGYQVLQAGSGTQALEICRKTRVDLVLSDWMMPGMNGLQFCQSFRLLNRSCYGYFILLTAKSEKNEVALGLQVGADDFLTKPVNKNELRARITAAERILRMERELTEKNALVSETLAEISALYESLDRDLIEARKLQQSLVSEKQRDFGSARISLLLRPSGHVGGDLVGYFPINDAHVGIFAIDVSGHGITSALMTARLAGFLSGTSPDQNLALTRSGQGGYTARSPAETAAHLNQLVLDEIQTEHYFTLLLGHLNLNTGQVVMTQAGHPHPLVQRPDGSVGHVGHGGMPIGLIAGAKYDEFCVTLHHGDRLLIPSDGITECPGQDKIFLDERGLNAMLRKNASLQGSDFLEALIRDLQNYAGEREFPDDISAVLVEFSGGG